MTIILCKLYVAAGAGHVMCKCRHALRAQLAIYDRLDIIYASAQVRGCHTKLGPEHNETRPKGERLARRFR